jgi:hypothetical protein
MRCGCGGSAKPQPFNETTTPQQQHNNQQTNTKQECAERIKSDTTGEAHCTGWAFDYWKCVDKCVAPKLFARLK